MEADEYFQQELLQDGDSDDEVCEGFTVEEVAESELKRIRKEVELAQLIRDLENEEGDETFSDLLSDEEEEVGGGVTDPYDCLWLKEFQEEFGPKNVANTASESDIFSQYFDDEVVDLFVEEMDRYYKEVIEAKGGIDSHEMFELPELERHRCR